MKFLVYEKSPIDEEVFALDNLTSQRPPLKVAMWQLLRWEEVFFRQEKALSKLMSEG